MSDQPSRRRRLVVLLIAAAIGCGCGCCAACGLGYLFGRKTTNKHFIEFRRGISVDINR